LERKPLYKGSKCLLLGLRGLSHLGHAADPADRDTMMTTKSFLEQNGGSERQG